MSGRALGLISAGSMTVVAAIATLALVPPAAAARSLPPTVPMALKDALAAVPGCRVDAIRVEGSFAVVDLCAESAPKACFSVRLDDPQEGCDGQRTGPWCLQWIAGNPPDAVRNTVRDALGTSQANWI